MRGSGHLDVVEPLQSEVRALAACAADALVPGENAEVAPIMEVVQAANVSLLLSAVRNLLQPGLMSLGMNELAVGAGVDDEAPW